MPEQLVEAKNPDDQMHQSAHYFDALPPKVQRVWMEEFREPKDGRAFYVCTWRGMESGTFSDGEGLCFQNKESRFPSMPDLRTCSRVLYEVDTDGGIEFMENSIITDSHEEGWVEEAGDALVILAKTPGLPLQEPKEDNQDSE